MADRLRSYNFEVVEKDVTGQFAQMAAMQQMPVPPDPSDEEVKDAVWVVFAEPPQQQQQSQFGEMPPSPVLGQKVGRASRSGRARRCACSAPAATPLTAALSSWGVEVKPDIVAVHEAMDAGAEDSADFVEQARRQPPIFVINDYGDSPVTDTLRSLDAAIVPMLPVIPMKPAVSGLHRDQHPAGADRAQELGRERSELHQLARQIPHLRRASGDLARAALQRRHRREEREGAAGRRLAVADFISNVMLNLPDPKLARSKVDVARFPGNGELFTNSIFWLAKQDQMIGLSPAAMDTARIVPMSAGVLKFWRIGVLLIGLPLLATMAGLFVHQTRKD